MISSNCSSGSRVLWIDLAKGFAIILVVFGHTLRGLHEAGLVHTEVLYRSIDNSVYLFHMPLFFFLSGLTFSGTRYKVSDFTVRLLRNIMWPYLLWTVIQITFKLLFAKQVNHEVNPGLYFSILYRPVSPFWFLYALAVIQLSTRLLLPKLNATAVFVIAALAFLAHFSFKIPSVVLDNSAEFGIYFVLGHLLAGWRPEARHSALGAWLGLSAFLSLEFGCLVLSVKYDSVAGRLMAFPIIFTVSLALAYGRAWTNRVVSYVLVIGASTMSIYCIHVLVTASSRIVLVHLHVRGLIPNLVVGTSLGVLIPLAVHFAAKRAGLTGWLGFGARGQPFQSKMEEVPA